MENYIVSARKYRPSTFESVVGQRALTTTLKNAIATGKLAHAYLFCGPRGVGKTTCARIFAKTINCMSPTADGEACNQCESCTAFNEQRSYNIQELQRCDDAGVSVLFELLQSTTRVDSNSCGAVVEDSAKTAQWAVFSSAACVIRPRP